MSSLKKMERWSGKVAVVTGASSGIGAAIAEALVHHGMLVVGMARREDRIKDLALKLANKPGKLYAKKVDVKSEVDIVSAFDWVEKELGGADVLVNNAANYQLTSVQEGTAEEWRSLLDVNVVGPVICTREYLKQITAHNKDQGHIFMINSLAGHMAFSIMPAYCASKSALRAVSKCLRGSLAETNSRIKVTDICPGLTRTELMNGTETQEWQTLYPAMESQDVAKVLVDALSASPITQICEIVMNPVPTNVGVY